MRHRCGTRQYWSPEFYRLDYSLKSDVWAVGVVMFGLFSGKFPFKNEKEVRHKEANFPKRVPKEGLDLMSHVFERDEEKRYEARHALEHPFLSPGVYHVEGAHLEEALKPEMGEFGANAGVVERRLELVNRIQEAHEGEEAVIEGALDGKAYTVADVASKRSLTYEWQNGVTAIKEIASTLDKVAAEPVAQKNIEVTEKGILKVLTAHNVPVNFFGKGKAKRFDEFLNEMQEGTSRMLIDATQYKSLVRAVDVVLLHLEFPLPKASKFLVEVGSVFEDGRHRTTRLQLPGVKKQPHETTEQTVQRLIHALGLEHMGIELDLKIQRTEQDDQSPSYPGIRTVYTKEVMTGRVTTTDKATLEKFTTPSTDDNGFTVAGVESEFPMSYAWFTEEETKAKDMKMKVEKDLTVSALVYPPVGLQEDELNAFLVENDIPLSHWGTGNYKSLSEFSEELVKGEASLVMQMDGKIVRVVDVVILKLMREGGDVLIEAEEEHKGQKVIRSRLPAVKRLYGEHQFLAARRLIKKFLKLPVNAVEIDPNTVKIVEEVTDSASYYGLSTLYRKRYMEGFVSPAYQKKA